MVFDWIEIKFFIGLFAHSNDQPTFISGKQWFQFECDFTVGNRFWIVERVPSVITELDEVISIDTAFAFDEEFNCRVLLWLLEL